MRTHETALRGGSPVYKEERVAQAMSGLAAHPPQVGMDEPGSGVDAVRQKMSRNRDAKGRVSPVVIRRKCDHVCGRAPVVGRGRCVRE